MLLLRRRKSDHSPPFFLRKHCECIIFPNCISVLQSTFPQGEIKPRREMEWRVEGKGGIWRRKRLFFLEGRVCTMYKCIRPCFWVCGEKRERVYTYIPPNRIYFPPQMCGTNHGESLLFPSSRERQNNRGNRGFAMSTWGLSINMPRKRRRRGLSRREV